MFVDYVKYKVRGTMINQISIARFMSSHGVFMDY